MFPISFHFRLPSGKSTIAYPLSVTLMEPTKGSMMGGTRVTILGSGFGTTKAVVKVKMGDSECKIESLADEKIVCMSGEIGKERVIDNSGVHPGERINKKKIIRKNANCHSVLKTCSTSLKSYCSKLFTRMT